MGQHGQSSLQCLNECLLLLRASLRGREREQWEEVEGQRGGDRREGGREGSRERGVGWGVGGQWREKSEGRGANKNGREVERYYSLQLTISSCCTNVLSNSCTYEKWLHMYM